MEIPRKELKKGNFIIILSGRKHCATEAAWQSATPAPWRQAETVDPSGAAASPCPPISVAERLYPTCRCRGDRQFDWWSRYYCWRSWWEVSGRKRRRNWVRMGSACCVQCGPSPRTCRRWRRRSAPRCGSACSHPSPWRSGRPVAIGCPDPRIPADRRHLWNQRRKTMINQSINQSINQ